jgi:hypothetical protein
LTSQAERHPGQARRREAKGFSSRADESAETVKERFW